MTRKSDDQKPASPAMTFWTWANDVYARPGVSESLISAQDNAGLNVNIVLWTCWSATAFEDIPEPVLQAAMKAVADWHNSVTTPLRAARRGAKPFEEQPGFQHAASLRKAVKKAELDAERIEIEILENCAARQLTPLSESGGRRRASRNLAQYAAIAGAHEGDRFSAALLQNVIDNIFPPPESERNLQERNGS